MQGKDSPGSGETNLSAARRTTNLEIGLPAGIRRCARRWLSPHLRPLLTGSQLDQERRLIHVSDVTEPAEQQISARQY